MLEQSERVKKFERKKQEQVNLSFMASLLFCAPTACHPRWSPTNQVQVQQGNKARKDERMQQIRKDANVEEEKRIQTIRLKNKQVHNISKNGKLDYNWFCRQ